MKPMVCVCAFVLGTFFISIACATEYAGHAFVHLEWDQQFPPAPTVDAWSWTYAETKCEHYHDSDSDDWPPNGNTGGSLSLASTPHGSSLAYSNATSLECQYHPGYYLLGSEGVEATIEDCSPSGSWSYGYGMDWQRFASETGDLLAVEVRAYVDVEVPNAAASSAIAVVGFWTGFGMSQSDLLLWEQDGWRYYDAGEEVADHAGDDYEHVMLAKEFGPGTSFQGLTSWTVPYLPLYGAICQSGTILTLDPTPEPTSLGLFVLGGLMFVGLRRAV